ncbi:MAG TPA: hydrogenase expression/formation protein HypE [Gemmatimonadaceae bacterium]|nr:hydrogenase expression/formation protein HypE [Gemmatimonadaceae bacterium]
MTTLRYSPATRRELTVVMKHGAGGRAMRRLIEEVLVRGLVDQPVDGFGLAAMDDGAALRVGDQWLVITTDSHVVHPIFFPGGDIGRLAISGTVNDLAMMGATEPLALTCGLILEEGFPYADLERVQQSMAETCREAGVPIVTGDTKVMGRGELDGLVLNTTGVALTRTLTPDSALQPGDAILVSGTIGDHGLALMASRHDLALSVELVSDVSPLNHMVRQALTAAPGAIVAMKDPTRGGVASALHEMAAKSRVGIVLNEADIPVNPVVRAAAEMLGLDPLHVANEGRAVMGVRGGDAAIAAVLGALRAHPQGVDAAVIGHCTSERPGSVILDTGLGRRLVAESEGEPLPRIC